MQSDAFSQGLQLHDKMQGPKTFDKSVTWINLQQLRTIIERQSATKTDSTAGIQASTFPHLGCSGHVQVSCIAWHTLTCPFVIL